MSSLSARFMTLDTLLLRKTEWLALVADSLEPNPFYGPDYLAAAEHHLHPRRPIRYLVVERQGVLVGLFPLERPFFRGLLFGRAWRLYRNPFTCLGTPLLHRDYAREALDCALETLGKAGGPKRLILPQVIASGPIAGMLAEKYARQGFALSEVARSDRAFVETELTAEDYARKHWSASRRKSLRKKRQLLEAKGVVTLRSVPAEAPEFSPAFAAFLALESAGWKGDAGTALLSSPASRAFAEAAFHAPGTLIEALMLNNRPIAMALVLSSGSTGFTVKVAYDPAFAEASPGTVLDAEMIALAAPGAPFRRLDSCALPGHPVEKFWIERKPLAELVLGLVPQRSQLGVTMLTRWMGFVDRLRMLRHSRSYTTKPVS
jgi:CelD/BcsL family acetyltransferase involved in cellulose biosynthesis